MDSLSVITKKLQVYFSDLIPDLQDIQSIEPLTGGYSNLTYQINSKNNTYILRQPPPGAKGIKGGHNMEREYMILDKLWNANFSQIPKVIHFCKNEDIIGTEFYLMQYIQGEVLRASNFKNYTDRLSSETMKVLTEKLCKTQAKLHQINIEQNDLITIGKPYGYIERQVKGWSDRYLASQTHELSNFNFLSNWLIQNLPSEIKPTLLHNDFKFDNVVFDENLLEIKAILDWEMCTVGDPRMDIGTTLSYWTEAGDNNFEKSFNISWLPGCMTRKAYIDMYSQLNPNIDLRNILYFYVFGLFKNAIVIQQIYSRYHKGLTQDQRFKHLDQGVQVLFQKATEAISKNSV